MDNLPVGVVTDADSDLFLTQGENALYVGADRYEEVSADELSSSAVTDGAETYIAGADDNGLVYRELRYVANGDGTYSVDNSCYSSSFDAAANDKTFYRHIVYEVYDADAVYGEGTEFSQRLISTALCPTAKAASCLRPTECSLLRKSTRTKGFPSP